jgi:hypothetical protein
LTARVRKGKDHKREEAWATAAPEADAEEPAEEGRAEAARREAADADAGAENPADAEEAETLPDTYLEQ